MATDYARFESLGANCELGFFLRDRGNEESTLFRWAETVQFPGLVNLIDRDFDGLFQFERLVPYNESMVLDMSCSTAWHSPIVSRLTDQGRSLSAPRLEFVEDETRRRALWAAQNLKMMHFVRKFREGLQDPRRIYVHKPRVETTTLAEAQRLNAVLRSRGRGRLLFVEVTADPAMIGTVRDGENGLLPGFVDRFAPGEQADDYSGPVWDRICRAAIACASPPVKRGWLPRWLSGSAAS
jgi:hypothetical protein